MRETLKMMKNILTGKESKANEKELIEKYQKYLSPNILAYFFVNNYGIISTTSDLYPLLLTEDKASFCLQELDKCLQLYDFDMSNKFITFFNCCYKNRLRMETEALMTQKKKSMLVTVDIDNYTDYLTTDLATNSNIDGILSNYALNAADKRQCRLLYIGYSLKEIAAILKQAPITIYKRQQKIKEKIMNLDINIA